MPTSRPNPIPTVVHLIRQLRPRSILDVGIGFGKWGHLFREYTDILEAERDPSRYERRQWQVRIDGIEGCAAYVTDMHRYLYNAIHVGDICEVLPRLGAYDVVFLGDVIEHLDAARGGQLLRHALAQARKAVIVTTPRFDTAQGDLCANELERHRSVWSARQFRQFPGAQVKTVDQDTLLAVFTKPGVCRLRLSPPRQPTPADARRLARAREQLVRLIPAGTPFVLVDEEQIRSGLPHVSAWPFLEKDGQYWGPPPDGETAIRELARLRERGARFVAFIWTTFWWLDHYAAFHDHLRQTCAVVAEDETVLVFALRPPA
ncbi:MAG: hypothetical protein JXQ71_01040 [Verrucomicrobia bacterium]|nr:hypothetical protein [Verrucomicrobiota bacterium]